MASPADIKLILDAVPTYDGNPKTLAQFIIKVEEIYGLLGNIQNITSLQKQIIFLHVRNKITDKANESMRNNQFSSWEQLKSHLINNFTDIQDPASLIIEILRHRVNGNVLASLAEIKEKFDVFRSKINILEGSESNKSYLIQFQEIVICNNFISSLKDPLRNNLATRNPKTLTQIERLIVNDFQYIKYEPYTLGYNSRQPKNVQNFIHKRPTNNTFPTGPINITERPKPIPMSTQTTQSWRKNQQPANYFTRQNAKFGQYRPHYVTEELHHTTGNPAQTEEFNDISQTGKTDHRNEQPVEKQTNHFLGNPGPYQNFG